MMQLVEKKTTIDQVRKVFQWTHEAGIDTFAYFIIGYVGETDRTMRATIDLAKELNPRYVMFTKATPLPETPLMTASIKAGLIDANYWRDFVLGKRTEPMKPCVPNASEWVERAYREFYLRPSRMLKQLTYIRSWSDIRNSFNAFLGILFFKMADEQILERISSSVDSPASRPVAITAMPAEPTSCAQASTELARSHPVRIVRHRSVIPAVAASSLASGDHE